MWDLNFSSSARPYSPHPVKPLTNNTLQGEKKAESRSVLEKLKSTINPGRSAPATTAEDEKQQVLEVYMWCCKQWPLLITHSIQLKSELRKGLIRLTRRVKVITFWTLCWFLWLSRKHDRVCFVCSCLWWRPALNIRTWPTWSWLLCCFSRKWRSRSNMQKRRCRWWCWRNETPNWRRWRFRSEIWRTTLTSCWCASWSKHPRCCRYAPDQNDYNEALRPEYTSYPPKAICDAPIQCQNCQIHVDTIKLCMLITGSPNPRFIKLLIMLRAHGKQIDVQLDWFIWSYVDRNIHRMYTSIISLPVYSFS